nr:unnamed protein product [Spirometra erinaceieuropaei]
MNDARLQALDDFVYLNRTLFRKTKVDDEVARLISKACQAFSRLRNTVLNRHSHHISTKREMYRAVILPTLLYEAGTWTEYKKQARRLNYFHVSCFQKILKPRWQNQIPDTDVLERMGILTIYIMPIQLQLRWSGHLVHMDDERSPRRLFYGEVATSSRRQGGQVRHYKDTPQTT